MRGLPPAPSSGGCFAKVISSPGARIVNVTSTCASVTCGASFFEFEKISLPLRPPSVSAPVSVMTSPGWFSHEPSSTTVASVGSGKSFEAAFRPCTQRPRYCGLPSAFQSPSKNWRKMCGLPPTPPWGGCFAMVNFSPSSRIAMSTLTSSSCSWVPCSLFRKMRRAPRPPSVSSLFRVTKGPGLFSQPAAEAFVTTDAGWESDFSIVTPAWAAERGKAMVKRDRNSSFRMGAPQQRPRSHPHRSRRILLRHPRALQEGSMKASRISFRRGYTCAQRRLVRAQVREAPSAGCRLLRPERPRARHDRCGRALHAEARRVHHQVEVRRVVHVEAVVLLEVARALAVAAREQALRRLRVGSEPLRELRHAERRGRDHAD